MPQAVDHKPLNPGPLGRRLESVIEFLGADRPTASRVSVAGQGGQEQLVIICGEQPAEDRTNARMDRHLARLPGLGWAVNLLSDMHEAGRQVDVLLAQSLKFSAPQPAANQEDHLPCQSRLALLQDRVDHR